jgi:hypothetical protein
MSDSNENYEVGYGKPPKSTRFKKGASGNPSGRPKKLLDFDEEFLREARSPITIHENGCSRRIAKHKAVIKQLVNNAIKGSSSGLRMYREAYRQASERVAELDAQRARDANREMEDFKDDELRQFVRDYQESQEW